MALGTQRANQSNLDAGGVWAIDTAAKANAELEPLQTPSMVNGHIAASNLRYYKDPLDVVHLQGTIDTRSATAATAFTLPAAYQPLSAPTPGLTFPLNVGIPSTGGAVIPINGSVNVDPFGVVSFSHFGTVPGVTLSSAISLDGISFPALTQRPDLPAGATLGTLQTNANSVLNLGAWVGAFFVLDLLPNANWNGSGTDPLMLIDPWGNGHMSGWYVTTIARAAGSAIAPHHLSPISRQSFACYATGVTSGANFVIVEAREDGNLVCMQALDAGGSIDFSTVHVRSNRAPVATTLGAIAASAPFDRNMFQPGPWNNIGLSGNTAVPSPYAVPAWRFDGKGRIELRGSITITGATVGTYSSPLPPADLHFHQASTNHMNLTPPRIGQTTVGASGTIAVGPGTNTPVPGGSVGSLDGISWRMV